MKATREVLLTRGLVAIVDADDYATLIAMGRWKAITPRSGGQTYAVHRTSRRADFRDILMHRVLCAGQTVDHINGNGLDNRRANLRPATYAENNMNRGPRADNACGYKGVHIIRETGRWRARIQVDGRAIHIGVFATAEGAAAAYDAAALRHHGEFAWLNSTQGKGEFQLASDTPRTSPPSTNGREGSLSRCANCSPRSATSRSSSTPSSTRN